MSKQSLRDTLSRMVVSRGLATIVRLCLRNLPLVILAASFTASGQENPTRNTKPQISVRLTIPQRTFTVGESLKVGIHISNVGSKPVLVGNLPSFFSMSSDTPSRIQFELRDNYGRSSPSVKFTDDRFSPSVEASPAIALLRYWLLLYPGHSLVVDVTLDKDLFEFLGKPGKYRLSANYSSNGLLYPPVYRAIGLTDEEVQSVPFQSWSGNISANTLNLEIVPVKAR